MKISLAQMDVLKSEPEHNINRAIPLIEEAARRGSDLIMFPEVWTTGFDYAMARDPSFIGDLAKEYKIWILGSTLVDAYNQATVFDSDGNLVGSYNKMHLFPLSHETKYLEPGEAPTIIETPWGKIGLAICFDIRFPELFRYYAAHGVKMVFVPIAFPEQRLPHWSILSKARAIENQCYLISCNRVGKETFPPGDAIYFGRSTIIDPWGEVVVEGSSFEEKLLTQTIDLAQVDRIRRKLPVLEGVMDALIL